MLMLPLAARNGCQRRFLLSVEKFILLWYNLFDK